MPPDAPLRIALFSEVYWPMVSGVGVTLLRLTEALQARGHQVRVYSATYPLPAGGRPAGGPPLAQRPFFLYPDVQWAFPRLRDVVEDLRASGPTWSMWRRSFRSASPASRPPASSASPSSPRPTPTTTSMPCATASPGRCGRGGTISAGSTARPTGCSAHPHLRGAPPQPRGHPHRDLEPGRGPGRVLARAFGARPTAARFGVGPGRSARDLYRADRAGEEPRPAARGLGDARPEPRRAQLVLVGRGPLEDEIRRREMPGRPRHRPAAGPALSEAYASADIFTFPSPTETFGNSLLEAMGSGLPSLVAAAGGVLEFAEHGGTPGWSSPTAPPAIADGPSAGSWPMPRCAAGSPRGRSRPRASGDWDAVYDRCWD